MCFPNFAACRQPPFRHVPEESLPQTYLPPALPPPPKSLHPSAWGSFTGMNSPLAAGHGFLAWLLSSLGDFLGALKQGHNAAAARADRQAAGRSIQTSCHHLPEAPSFLRNCDMPCNLLFGEKGRGGRQDTSLVSCF